MITLAIDGSTRATGWAVFDDLRLVDYGVVRRSDEEEIDVIKRVVYMAYSLREIFIKYNPSQIYMEQVPPVWGNQNVETQRKLGTLQGAILMMAIECNIPLQFIPLFTWRSNLNLPLKGERKILKESSINYANQKYGLELIFKGAGSKYTQDDIADAICIGTYALGNYEKKEGKRGIGKSKK